MTETAPMFIGRPSPPEIGSDSDFTWRQIRAISYQGGYISSAYGNLVQTFALTERETTCQSKNVSTTVKGHDRYNTIGGAKTTVAQFSKNYKVFPGKTSSMAAGGDPITIITDLGSFTARMGGDVQTLIQYLCDNRASMYGPTYIVTARGKQYGPYGPNPDT